jgi:parvulin-like peptidyl-prolyl isomerase
VGAVFGLDQGALSEPVRVPRGYALALVEEILPPRDPELGEVLPKVRQAAEAERRQQLAMERLGNAAADVAEGKATIDEAIAALGLEAQQSGEFGRGGAIPGLGYHPVIAEAAMELEAGEVGGPYGTSQGAVLLEVTSRTEWDPEQFAVARLSIREQVEGERLGRLISALIEQRKLELGVSYDRRLVEELGLAPAEPA